MSKNTNHLKNLLKLKNAVIKIITKLDYAFIALLRGTRLIIFKPNNVQKHKPLKKTY